MIRAKIAHFATHAALAVAVIAAAGCASPATGAAETPVTTMLDKPGGPGTSAVSQLDYFDALSRRSSVTWDELLAGVLMAAGKRADGTYADRLTAARRAGIVSAQQPPSATSAATPGELARLLLRAQGVRMRDTITDEEAIAIASRRSLVPMTLGPGDPLTGETVVNALAAVGKPASASQPTQATPPRGGSKP